MEAFFKFHGAGNDFVVLDRRASGTDIGPDEARWWCDRHVGVGADGVLVVKPHHAADAEMVVHNPDGSIAEMCGNGIRCVAAYLAGRAGLKPRTLSIATGAGVLDCRLTWQDGEVDQVTVAMGPARLEARELAPGGPFRNRPLPGLDRTATAVSMGNPHLVLLDGSLDEAGTLGPRLERSPLFPDRTNVEFVQRRASGGLSVVVWERGAGLTRACGTGACAATVAFALEGRVPFDEPVPVELPGGLLHVKVAASLEQVWLTGPVRAVFEGRARPAPDEATPT